MAKWVCQSPKRERPIYKWHTKAEIYTFSTNVDWAKEDLRCKAQHWQFANRIINELSQ